MMCTISYFFCWDSSRFEDVAKIKASNPGVELDVLMDHFTATGLAHGVLTCSNEECCYSSEGPFGPRDPRDLRDATLFEAKAYDPKRTIKNDPSDPVDLKELFTGFTSFTPAEALDELARRPPPENRVLNSYVACRDKNSCLNMQSRLINGMNLDCASIHARGIKRTETKAKKAKEVAIEKLLQNMELSMLLE